MSVLALGFVIPNLPGLFGWNGCNVQKPQLRKPNRMFSVTKVKDHCMIVLNEDKIGRKSDSFLLQFWNIRKKNYANLRELFSSRWSGIFFIDQIVAWTYGPIVLNILIPPPPGHVACMCVCVRLCVLYIDRNKWYLHCSLNKTKRHSSDWIMNVFFCTEKSNTQDRLRKEKTLRNIFRTVVRKEE